MLLFTALLKSFVNLIILNCIILLSFLGQSLGRVSLFTIYIIRGNPLFHLSGSSGNHVVLLHYICVMCDIDVNVK